MILLELKQIWDEYDSNLYSKERRRLTDQGYQTFWQAVDRTVKYAMNTQDQHNSNQQANPVQETSRRGFYPRRPYGGRRHFGYRGAYFQ